MNLRTALFGQTAEQYGEDYRRHLMEQYKLYVEMADRISSRRQTANSFFLTVNSALLASIGVLLNRIDTPKVGMSVVAISVTGAVLCYLWYRLVRSYRDLNSAKFTVIHELEALLPARLYAAEWLALGEGTDPERYLPFTNVEIRIPWIFFILHVVVGFVSVLV